MSHPHNKETRSIQNEESDPRKTSCLLVPSEPTVHASAMNKSNYRLSCSRYELQEIMVGVESVHDRE